MTQVASVVLRGRIPSLTDWWIDGSPLWEMLWHGTWEPAWRPSPLGLGYWATRLPVDQLRDEVTLPTGYTAMYWDPRNLGDPLPTIACRLVRLSAEAVLLADFTWQGDHPEIPEDDDTMVGDLVVSRPNIEAILGSVTSVDDVVSQRTTSRQRPTTTPHRGLRRPRWRPYEHGWTLTDPLGGSLWAHRLAGSRWLARVEDHLGARWASTLDDVWLHEIAKRMAAGGTTLSRRRENLTRLETGKPGDSIRIASQFTDSDLDRLWRAFPASP